MVLTTCLSPQEESAPCSDGDIEVQLAEARQRSGKNIRVTTTRIVSGALWWRRERTYYELCIFVDGMLPWQVITCASGDRGRVIAYLYGYLQGMDDKRAAPPAGAEGGRDGG